MTYIKRSFKVDILIGLLIKTIDIIVSIVSIFERKTSKLLSKLSKSKDKTKG